MEFDRGEISYVPTTGVRSVHEAPLVAATDATLEGYGALVIDPRTFPIEIVRWPAQGWRPIDPNSGDQGGVTEGVFEFWWKGDTLFARNNAVGDNYLFGWSTWPEEARDDGVQGRADRRLSGGPTITPMAASFSIQPTARALSCRWRCRATTSHPTASPRSCATDRADSTSTRAFGTGRCARMTTTRELLDRQSRVHARVSVDFPKEFGCYLAVPLDHQPVV